ncbi:HalOD1 output domain-containing protein [Haloterrigena salinisoli]|uniref:HalOD1 output domain-containing protein n=1 Tax=Haloterrigena salinisoli TaxID=3132747 RepID=UPI0030D480CB
MATEHHRNADRGSSSTDEQTYVFSSEKAPTLAVIEAVASASEADPTSLPPLYDAIDPDALDATFESTASQPGETRRVSFSYGGFDVAVGDGPGVTVTLEETTD